jgi:L-lactate dehydrogenase complex protein LldF
LPVLKEWTSARDVPQPPQQTFRDWWQRAKADNSE